MTSYNQDHIDGYMQGLQRALKLCAANKRDHEHMIRMEIRHSQMLAERKGFRVEPSPIAEQRGPDAGVVFLCAVFGLIGFEILRWVVHVQHIV